MFTLDELAGFDYESARREFLQEQEKKEELMTIRQIEEEHARLEKFNPGMFYILPFKEDNQGSR